MRSSPDPIDKAGSVSLFKVIALVVLLQDTVLAAEFTVFFADVLDFASDEIHESIHGKILGEEEETNLNESIGHHCEAHLKPG